MAKHQRRTPLLNLLIRLGWQCDPELWTVRCRDNRGRRARLQVHLTARGIALTVPGVMSLQLGGRQVGQLRAALRDAICTLDQLGTTATSSDPSSVRPPPPPTRPPSTRERVEISRPARPSVAQLTARLSRDG